MTATFLDTSAYTHLSYAHARMLEAVSGAGRLAMPVIVLGELEAGFRIGTQYVKNRARLDAFLAQELVVTAGIDEGATRRYGETLALLRKKGTPLPTNDLWIAAIVLSNGGHLITFDGDFKRIPGLDVEVLSPDR